MFMSRLTQKASPTTIAEFPDVDPLCGNTSMPMRDRYSLKTEGKERRILRATLDRSLIPNRSRVHGRNLDAYEDTNGFVDGTVVLILLSHVVRDELLISAGLQDTAARHNASSKCHPATDDIPNAAAKA